jgi:protease I
MAKIAIIFPQRFEEPEYRKAAEAFHRAGHELVHLEGRGKEEKQNQGSPWKTGKPIKEVSVEDFDALLIPGGYHPERLEFAEEELHFFRKFLETGKPVFGTGLKEA